MKKVTIKSFGEIIMSARKSRYISRADLASEVNVSRYTIYFWEHGFGFPSDKQISSLMRILKLSFTNTFYPYKIDTEKESNSLYIDNIVEATIINFHQLHRKGILKGYISVIITLIFAIICFGFITLVFQARSSSLGLFPRITSGYMEAGDVLARESLFPQHSAYELGLNSSGKPVFRVPYVALKQIQTDCSDAISAIKSEYKLRPFSQWSVMTYITYSWQLNRTDQNTLAQTELLSRFGDIYENSFQ